MEDCRSADNLEMRCWDKMKDWRLRVMRPLPSPLETNNLPLVAAGHLDELREPPLVP